MKTPLPEPVQAVCVMVSNIGSTHMTPKGNYYTSKQLLAAMVAAYNEAIEDAAKVCTKDAEQFAKDDWQSTALACYACTNTIRKMKETP